VNPEPVNAYDLFPALTMLFVVLSSLLPVRRPHNLKTLLGKILLSLKPVEMAL
jgi:hypothetical protein